MKNQSFAVILLLSLSLGFSCKGDDTLSCTTCSSPQTANFEVCEDGDGNAVVNGENTNTPYSLYISDLTMAGASCGG